MYKENKTGGDSIDVWRKGTFGPCGKFCQEGYCKDCALGTAQKDKDQWLDWIEKLIES